MRLQPIVYTKDMTKAITWYGNVLGLVPSYQSDVWTTFDVGGAYLAIHRVDGDLANESRIGISLVATDPLEDLMQRWSATGQVEVVRGIQDETFGRSLLLADPDGTFIQVNEHA